MPGEGTHGRQQVELLLASVPTRQLFEAPLSAIACVMVAEGTGVTILDPFCASEFAGRGIVLRRLRNAPLDKGALVKAKNRPLSEIAKQFEAAFVAHTRKFLTDQLFLRHQSTNTG